MAAKFPKYFLFKRYMDSGYSWFAVRRIWLERLQIEHKISPFSYEKGLTVFLEEDNDFDILATALLAKGIKYDWKTVYQDGNSTIRKYWPYHFSYNKYNNEKASWFYDGEIHLHTIQGNMIYQVGDNVYDIIKRRYFPANLFRVGDTYYQWASELPLSTAKE